jgi:hypothetical protein
MNKLKNTLYSAGSFKMEIINSTTTLPNTFDQSVQSLARDRSLLPNPYIA